MRHDVAAVRTRQRGVVPRGARSADSAALMAGRGPYTLIHNPQTIDDKLHNRYQITHTPNTRHAFAAVRVMIVNDRQ